MVDREAPSQRWDLWPSTHRIEAARGEIARLVRLLRALGVNRHEAKLALEGVIRKLEENGRT